MTFATLLQLLHLLQLLQLLHGVADVATVAGALERVFYLYLDVRKMFSEEEKSLSSVAGGGNALCALSHRRYGRNARFSFTLLPIKTEAHLLSPKNIIKRHYVCVHFHLRPNLYS